MGPIRALGGRHSSSRARAGTRPKNDIAKEIAQAIFENDPDEIYKALLKGNAYTFKELAERAYGKIKESHEQTSGDGAPLEVTVKFVEAHSGRPARCPQNQIESKPAVEASRMESEGLAGCGKIGKFCNAVTQDAS